MDSLQQSRRKYQEKNAWLSNVEQQQNETDTEFGYRHMNTRMLELERRYVGEFDWKDRQKEHLDRKRQIEAQWHENTGDAAQQLEARAKEGFNKKEPEYYENYDLKDLEVLIKNSDRGGNSDEYNNVATDLEIYNTCAKDGNPGDLVELRQNLLDSCKRYLETRKNPFTTKGKVRKAIITQIAQKISEKMQEEGETLDFSKEGLIQACTQKFNEFNAEQPVSIEKLRLALKSHMDLLQAVSKGLITVTKEEMQTVDANFATLMQVIKEQPVDGDQSNSMSTRFFNVLGWAANTPEIVSDSEITMRAFESPVPAVMYHCINTVGANTDAMTETRQLYGQEGQRQFYSNGMYGKGTYMGALKVHMDEDNLGEPVHEGKTEDDVQQHLWSSYGNKPGAVQVKMCLNGNAKVIGSADVTKMARDYIQQFFPNLYSQISESRFAGNQGNTSARFGSQELSMFAALLGYNTIKGAMGTMDGSIDYFVTFDRGALCISNLYSINHDGFGNGEPDIQGIND